MHVTRYCGDDDEYDDDDDYDDDDQGDGDGGGRSAVAGFQFVDLVQTRCGPNGDPAGVGASWALPCLVSTWSAPGLHLVYKLDSHGSCCPSPPSPSPSP